MSDHYFSMNPEASSAPSEVGVKLPDLSFKLKVDSGVFAVRALDKGTAVLLTRNDPPTSEGDLLDIGCGYGPIALTLAQRFLDRHIWAIDINQRALQLTKANADRLHLSNVTVCLPEDVPTDVTFGGIYANPPIKVGKSVLHEILRHWLPALKPEASAYLVVHKHLGSDSLQSWLETEGYDVERLSSRQGFRTLQVSKPV